MESLTLRDWRPGSFLVVAQLDVTVEALQGMSFAVELDEVHREHTAVARLPPEQLFCLVATPDTPFGGFVLLCGDPEGFEWEEALDIFLSGTPFDRSAVTWVPSDADET